MNNYHLNVGSTMSMAISNAAAQKHRRKKKVKVGRRSKKARAPASQSKKKGPSNALKSDPKGPPKDPVLSPELQPVTTAYGESPPSTNAPEAPPVIIIQESSGTKSANPVETQDSQGGNALETGEL